MNSFDVSVNGTENNSEAYILFDGLLLGHSDSENMYLDQQNETVICTANCVFTGAGENCTTADCAAIVVGPGAPTRATGLYGRNARRTRPD